MLAKKEWSYRLAKVAAALVAFSTLMSVGVVQPRLVQAGPPCVVMPDGSCMPAMTDVIIRDPVDLTQNWDPREADEMKLDMSRLTSGTPEHPVVAVDRKQVHFDVLPWVNPETNRTLVPIRFISEALGAQVTWVEERPDEVLIERPGLRIFFRIGDNKADVNGRTVYMDQRF